MLTRDAILGFKAELPRRDVPVPALGGSVSVRTMTGAERDRFEYLLGKNERRNFRATLLVFTACDESGALLFTEADIPALTKLPAPALEPAVEAALEVNRFTSGDVEELRKNSEASPSDASASA